MGKQTLFIIGMGILWASSACALELSGLSQPESVILDSGSGNYFISNVNGKPLEKDNNGYISKVSRDGVVVVLKFIEGREDGPILHAPKGLAVVDDLLFTTDIDRLLGFDLETGELKREITFAGEAPKFLNDLAVSDDGLLYASDMTGGRIYRVDVKKGGTVSILCEGEALGQPNGLYYDRRSRHLIVATWAGGKLLKVSPDGTITRLKENMEEGLDGVAAGRHGRLYVSSFTKGEIYEIADDGQGELTLFHSGLKTPADIFFDASSRELIVPLMDQGALTSFKTES